MNTPAENKGATMPDRNEAMRQQLFEALEVDGYADLSPAAFEMVTRRILNMDDEPFTQLMGAIQTAKVRYARRVAQ
ncbi:hypothetical protein ACFWUZ_20555 [Streptomyces sp. NPDC058646]|uniref:hypothetical protein n=1 Tax=Streptomyces sp. NPDC058646 TaxID=3346574 RepID=UPI003655B25C